MKRKLLVLSLALGPVLLLSQGAQETPDGEKITRVVHVHGQASELAVLAGHASDAHVQGSNQLRAVVIKGKPSDVAAVERIIQQLDVAVPAATPAAQNIELVVYVIGGSMQPIPGMLDAGGDALAPVLKQLRAIFPYKNYAMVSTMLLRSGQESKARTSGMMKTLQMNTADDSASYQTPATYEISYDSASVSPEPSPLIHLEKFRFDAKIPVVTGFIKGKDASTSYATSMNMVSVGAQTDVDLREGQKVVVANSNIQEADASLFLVLTAHVVQ